MSKFLVIVLMAAFGATVWAQKNDGNQAFDALDKNRDGFLSKQEAAGEKELAKRFTKFDAAKDGRLNANEFAKANQANDARVLADSAVTTKVKALLLAEKGLSSGSISVATYEGRVLLSGFVDSKEQAAKAGKVATGVSGVRKVENHLAVK